MTYLGHCHHPIGSYQSGYAWVPGPYISTTSKFCGFVVLSLQKHVCFLFFFSGCPSLSHTWPDFSTPGNICQHHLLNHHHQEQIHQRHHPSLMSVTMFPHCFFSSWQLPSAPFAVLSRYWWEIDRGGFGFGFVWPWRCHLQSGRLGQCLLGGKAGDQLQGLSDLADKI